MYRYQWGLLPEPRGFSNGNASIPNVDLHVMTCRVGGELSVLVFFLALVSFGPLGLARFDPQASAVCNNNMYISDSSCHIYVFTIIYLFLFIV